MTEQGFEFRVANVSRMAAYERFAAHFTVSVGYDQVSSAIPHEEALILDLDLDASGGSSPTTFFESFEAGFGAFTTMHLDEELNPPDDDLGVDYPGLQNSDGYRCQYDDPDFQRTGSSLRQANRRPRRRRFPSEHAREQLRSR